MGKFFRSGSKLWVMKDKEAWTAFKLDAARSSKYKILSTSLFMYCCTSSSAFCLTWCLTNMMLRSTIFIIQCHNKNGKYQTTNLHLFQQVEYLCWLVTWIDWEITMVYIQSHFKPSGKRTICTPSPLDIYLFQTPLPCGISMTLHGWVWTFSGTTQWNF